MLFPRIVVTAAHCVQQKVQFRGASASERRSLATVLYPSLGFIADRARVLGYVP